MVCLRCRAVLTTDEEFVERETYLNCVEYASAVLDLLEHCFLNLGRRDVVARFISTGRKAAACTFEKCIRMVIDALKTALEEANASTGDTSLNHGSVPMDG